MLRLLIVLVLVLVLGVGLHVGELRAPAPAVAVVVLGVVLELGKMFESVLGSACAPLDAHCPKPADPAVMRQVQYDAYRE